jgi:glycosyltransferase involved in cell wall biosynthesis
MNSNNENDKLPGTGLRVAVWVGLSEKKCLEQVSGLDACDMMESGLLFRRYPVKGLNKFRQVCPPKFLRSLALFSHLYALFISVPLCLWYRPHVCVGISLMPHSVLAKLAQLTCRAKFITWFIGTDIYAQLAQKWWGKLLRIPMSKASCTLTMGSGSNKMLEKLRWPPQNLLIGRNAYDLSEYTETSECKKWDIIYTGRLDRKHKRLDLLLRTVSEMCISRPSTICAIVGDGPDRERLEGICKSLGLESNVEFIGYSNDIPSLLNQSRTLVMTSAWEGLPSSIVEAFALGLPVVASDVGDISDIVTSGENGILVDSDRPEDYAEAVLHILMEPGVYAQMSLSAKQTGENIRKEMDSGVWVKRWEQALKRAGL